MWNHPTCPDFVFFISSSLFGLLPGSEAASPTPFGPEISDQNRYSWLYTSHLFVLNFEFFVPTNSHGLTPSPLAEGGAWELCAAVDPWPRRARSARHLTDGEDMELVQTVVRTVAPEKMGFPRVEELDIIWQNVFLCVVDHVSFYIKRTHILLRKICTFHFQ